MQQQQQQQQPPPLTLPTSHSRHTSLSRIPNSPPVRPKLESDTSPVRRDSFGFRQYPSVAGQQGGISQPQPVVSPAVETSRPATPGQVSEPPRQVPAKRSNIMSILNDEPEEPSPRKRFASEQVASVPVPTAPPQSKGVYAGPTSLSHQEHLSRQEETFSSSSPQRAFGYSQPSQYLTQPTSSRSYPEYGGGYPSVQSSSGSRASNDWMARFDPRGQQQQQTQTQSQQQLPSFSGNRATATPAPQPTYSAYGASQSQQASSLTAPSPAPTPPPATQLSTYHSRLSQGSSSLAPASPRIPSLMGNSRDVPHPPSQLFQQTIGSPPPRSRSGSGAYASRQGPPTPIRSPVHMLNITSRQPSGQTVYSSSAPTTQVSPHGASQHSSSSHTPYPPHIQQQAPHHHRTALNLAGPGGGQYGLNPPSSQQLTRGSTLSVSQPSSSSRSYTPPTPLHPNTTHAPPLNGLSYVTHTLPPSIHSLQSRHPGSGSLTESPHGTAAPVQPDHHRVYSQGSNSLPGPLGAHPPR